MSADLFEFNGQIQMAGANGISFWWEDFRGQSKLGQDVRRPLRFGKPMSAQEMYDALATGDPRVPLWLAGTVESIGIMSEDGKTSGGNGFRMTRRVLRDGTTHCLGVVGGGEKVSYDPHGEMDTLLPLAEDLLNAARDAAVGKAGEMGIVTIGALGETRGHRSFLSLRLPDVDGMPEPGVNILTLGTSHDGKSETYGIRSRIVVVCANTERQARNSALVRFAVRHTAAGRAKLADAPAALLGELAVQKGQAKRLQEMLNRDLTANEFTAFLDIFAPKADTVRKNPERKTRTDGTRDRLGELFLDCQQTGGRDRFRDLPGRAGDASMSAYALLQAATEWLSHERPLRGSDCEESDRYVSNLFGSGADKSDTMWDGIDAIMSGSVVA